MFSLGPNANILALILLLFSLSTNLGIFLLIDYFIKPIAKYVIFKLLVLSNQHLKNLKILKDKSNKSSPEKMSPFCAL